MLTIGWMGCAHIHMPGFVKRVKDRAADVKVRAVWDPDPARAKTNADALGCVTVTDPAAILGDPQVQAVVVCSETNRHEELVLPAAKPGRWVTPKRRGK